MIGSPLHSKLSMRTNKIKPPIGVFTLQSLKKLGSKSKINNLFLVHGQ